MSYILKETYARLIIEYLLHVGKNHPRFVLLGFDDVRGQILEQLKRKDISAVEPEHSGRLKEASLLRGKSDEPCVILISKKNLGKFASLVTAFKVVENVIPAGVTSEREIVDVHNLLDISRWLINEYLVNIGEVIEKRVGKLPAQATYNGIKAVLSQLWSLTNEKPSFAEWIHPRRLLKGLVEATGEMHIHHSVSLASFLRIMGIESTEKLESLALFAPSICKDENLKELKNSLVDHSTILRKCVASDVSSQRRNLANICMNHLRSMLYKLAKDEVKTSHVGDWTKVLFDFEYAYSTKQRVVRKYRVESRGVRIRRRSNVSGLPICFHVPLEVNLEETTDRNLLQEFASGKMKQILQKHSKLSTAKFSLKPIALAEKARSLLIEFSLKEKDGSIVLDPLLKGLRSPTSEINRLFASITSKGGK